MLAPKIAFPGSQDIQGEVSGVLGAPNSTEPDQKTGRRICLASKDCEYVAKLGADANADHSFVSDEI